MTKLHQPDLSSLALLFFAVSIIPGGVCEGAEVTEIAQRRQLFLDRLLIDRLDGAWLRMHEPVRREKVLHLNKPWEGIISWCPVVLRDGDRYQMWYRSREKSSAKNHVFVGYAESSDGIAWERPELGLFEFEGSKANNICIDGRHMSNVGLFIDHNPQTPPDARYKAVGLGSDNGRSAILGMVSPDGIHWRPAKEGALVLGTKDDPVFEAPQGAFWDSRQERYAIYTRGWRHPDADGRIRSIRMTTSEDFVNWEPFQYIRLADGKWPEELYTEFSPVLLPGAALPDVSQTVLDETQVSARRLAAPGRLRRALAGQSRRCTLYPTGQRSVFCGRDSTPRTGTSGPST